MFKNKVGRPSNETIKKRRIFNIVLIVIIFVVLFSLTYTLTNISTKRLTGGGPIYYGVSCDENSACYESGFRNGNLYQIVIDRYNIENSASLSYTDVITDDELATITYLDADDGEISDATGIEKLVNLEELYLMGNELTSINLSNLTNLERLYLSSNNLSEIDLSNLTNLDSLNLSGNNLNEIDVRNNINLEYMYLQINNLSSIDISNLINLEELDLSGNNLSEINVSNLTNLEYLYLSNNNLTSIDVSNLTNLEDLYLSNNNLTSIDVSSLINLTSLKLNDNHLTSIDLSNLTSIEELYLEGNNLSEIDLNNLSHLENLSLDIELYSTINYENFNNLTLRNDFIILPGEQVNISSVIDNFNVQNTEYPQNIISYKNGLITALKEGYARINFDLGDNIYYMVDVYVSDKVKSSNYEINHDNKYLYVGSDTNEEIKSNLSIDNKYFLIEWCELGDNYTEEELNECLEELKRYAVSYRFKIQDNKLRVDMLDDKEIHTMEYKLGRINLSNYNVEGKVITASSFNVDDIEKSNVILEYNDNILIVKDLNGNEVDRYIVNISGNNDNENNGNNNDNNVDDNTNNNEELPNNNQNDSDNKINDNINNTNNTNNDTTSKKTTLNKFDNAKTYDGIIKYFIIGGASVLLISGLIIYTKKKR